MTAVPLPLVDFDVPGSPREETRSYDGSLSRFGSPVAAPALDSAPELGRAVMPTPSPLDCTAQDLLNIATDASVRDAALRSLASSPAHVRAVCSLLVNDAEPRRIVLEEQLTQIQDAADGLERSYQVEREVSARLLNDLIAARQESAVLRKRLIAEQRRTDALNRAAANLLLERHELARNNVLRACEILDQQARLDALARFDDTHVMDPADWYADDTQTPREPAETMAQTMEGGR